MADLLGMRTLLPPVVAAVQAAGRTLAGRYSADARPIDRATLLQAIAANNEAVDSGLRSALLAARPGSLCVEDEDEEGELTVGEWWVVDAVEGNVNHVHGRVGWGVTATLVQGGLPVLTTVVLPLSGETWTAIRGCGALVNGVALTVSRKADLGVAVLGTGQAKPGENAETHDLIGRSVTAMLGSALLVRMSVPATLELLEVAAGRMDGFWQHSQVRSGLVAGALLVQEAGGVVTDTRGRPWTLASQDLLAAAPGVHSAAVAALSGDRRSTRDGRAA